jgi:hypothetical protein
MPAAAGPLPDALYNINAGVTSLAGSFGAVTAVLVKDQSCQPSWFGGSCTTQAMANDTMWASANGSAIDGGSTSAQAILGYSFEVLGPSNVTVPLSIIGSADTAAGGMLGTSSWATSALQVKNSSNVSLAYFTLCSGLTGGGCLPLAHANWSASFGVTANTISKVGMEAQGGAHGGVVAGTFSATVDPIITIDPLFLALNPGYSLVFSANISQPVPESGTAAMFALGLTGLAFARTRRRAEVGASWPSGCLGAGVDHG